MKSLFVLLAMSMLCISTFTSCSKEAPTYCYGCAQPIFLSDALSIDYPSTTTPGYFTTVKAILNETVSHPIIVSWYASSSLNYLPLQQVDTLTSGFKAWYSFIYPANYNNGILYIKCKVNLVNDERILEKTISIKSNK